MKILAVDDDPLSLAMLEAAAREAGFGDVTPAASAEEAREIILASTDLFGCFLVDIQMPGADGIDFCRMLRRMPGYASAPVIMVTSLSSQPALLKAFAAGATDYVTKPCDPQALAARVRKAARQEDVEARMRAAAASVVALKAELAQTRRVGFDAPVTLREVENAIDYLALETYLQRLGRGDLAGASLFTFRIDRIETFFARCHPTLYGDMLADVAEALLEALLGHRPLVSYAGSGIFAAVVSGGHALDLAEVELAVNQAAEELWLDYGAGEGMGIRLTAGAPAHLGSETTGRGAVNALRTAIDRLQPQPHQAAPAALAARWRMGVIGSFLRAV